MNRNGFFSTIGFLKSDPLELSFYGSEFLHEALVNLKKDISSDDFEFYERFYNHFAPLVDTYLAESAAFKDTIEKINEVFTEPSVIDVMNRAFRFYNLNRPIKYTVLFTWWPPINHDNASPTGDYLILRKNPKMHLQSLDADIAFHEVIHSLSTLQNLINKKEYTNIFLKKCPIQGKMKKYRILEEPLAVAIGQMYFLEKVHPDKYRRELEQNSWYRDRWVNSFAHIIYPKVKSYLGSNRPMDSKLIEELGDLCANVQAFILVK